MKKVFVFKWLILISITTELQGTDFFFHFTFTFIRRKLEMLLSFNFLSQLSFFSKMSNRMHVSDLAIKPKLNWIKYLIRQNEKNKKKQNWHILYYVDLFNSSQGMFSERNTSLEKQIILPLEVICYGAAGAILGSQF